MDEGTENSDIISGRVSSEEAVANFSDLHPRLTQFQAAIEADRCYFCFDAPCTQACPTTIDIPLFIRQIKTQNTPGSASTILHQNIMGGMCARVCPTETLCEKACVRLDKEGTPVKIGQLQRFATDHLMDSGEQLFTRKAESGKCVAVIGGGPAGLACAHGLAREGHAITVFEAHAKLGGLNEYGIAAYKTTDDFAQREVDFILDIGGIDVKTEQRLGENIALDELRSTFDAVFLAIGMGGVHCLNLKNEDGDGVIDAVTYIANLRQSDDLSTLPVGRRVVVVGGGMTAVDVAVQSRLLGADDVTIVYRRNKENMNASTYEQDLAQTSGVKIKTWATPVAVEIAAGKLTSVEFARTRAGSEGKLEITKDRFRIEADIMFKAIGQNVVTSSIINTKESVVLEKRRIVVDAERKTNLADVWAGGDCIVGGQDLTVAAVEDGKIAAHSIHQFLQQETPS